MSLLDAVRAGVGVANSITKPLQGSVTYKKCTATTWDGTRTEPTSVTLLAIIEMKQQNVKTLSGEVALSTANVLFLDVAALLAATGSDGIGANDTIILPDGKTGPILNFGGTVDAGTGRPFAMQVYLG